VKLIGLSGTNGSGKDTLGLFLAEKYGYLFISGSDMLREECRRRGLEVSRENLRMISSEWRRTYGLGVLIDRAVDVFKGSASIHKGLVVSPMRNVGEAQHLKDIGGTLIWVDADPRIRYERIQKNHRGRADEDNKTYEEFLDEEKAEMHPSDPNDPSVLNMAGVRDIADVQLLNETNLEELQRATEAALSLS
jgi:dephospho-CoA kinase